MIIQKARLFVLCCLLVFSQFASALSLNRDSGLVGRATLGIDYVDNWAYDEELLETRRIRETENDYRVSGNLQARYYTPLSESTTFIFDNYTRLDKYNDLEELDRFQESIKFRLDYGFSEKFSIVPLYRFIFDYIDDETAAIRNYAGADLYYRPSYENRFGLGFVYEDLNRHGDGLDKEINEAQLRYDRYFGEDSSFGVYYRFRDATVDLDVDYERSVWGVYTRFSLSEKDWIRLSAQYSDFDYDTEPVSIRASERTVAVVEYEHEFENRFSVVLSGVWIDRGYTRSADDLIEDSTSVGIAIRKWFSSE